jgi:hypothetical protein
MYWAGRLTVLYEGEGEEKHDMGMGLRQINAEWESLRQDLA